MLRSLLARRRGAAAVAVFFCVALGFEASSEASRWTGDDGYYHTSVGWQGVNVSYSSDRPPLDREISTFNQMYPTVWISMFTEERYLKANLGWMVAKIFDLAGVAGLQDGDQTEYTHALGAEVSARAFHYSSVLGAVEGGWVWDLDPGLFGLGLYFDIMDTGVYAASYTTGGEMGLDVGTMAHYVIGLLDDRVHLDPALGVAFSVAGSQEGENLAGLYLRAELEVLVELTGWLGVSAKVIRDWRTYGRDATDTYTAAELQTVGLEPADEEKISAGITTFWLGVAFTKLDF